VPKLGAITAAAADNAVDDNEEKAAEAPPAMAVDEASP
jgi:hypothetical protein